MTNIYLKYLVKYFIFLFDNKYSLDKLLQQELLLLNIIMKDNKCWSIKLFFKYMIYIYFY